jgi:UDP-N-acetylmuramoylalanine--D-glutamate ligase
LIDLIRGKEVLVVGMARSGVAAVEVLAGGGASKITVTDSKQAAELQEALVRLSRYPQVLTVTGENPPELVTKELSLIIKSPGIPPNLEIFKRAEKLKVPVRSEIELAYHFLRPPVVGITGTNGKTTTTALVTEILKKARFDPVVAAGNIGNPLSGLVGRISAQGLIVAELSSFQLEDIECFRPLVAVWLNFAEDHLDYHGSLDRYFQAKARIFENQVASDYAILNSDDPSVAALADQCKATVLWFSRKPVSVGCGVEDGLIKIYNGKAKPVDICPLSELALPGDHNLENALAAATAAWAAGADPESIGSVLQTFKAIEHRLELVRTVNGIDYINDSKGTNPGATIKALSSFPGKKLILIAGGKEKGADFSGLAEIVSREVRFLVLLGETREKIAEAVGKAGFENYRFASTLDEAVNLAAGEAEQGEVVMLSPACASWDMFQDYEERGKKFKELVNQLETNQLLSGVQKDGNQS